MQIQTDIPIPPRRTPGPYSEAMKILRQMRPGDSLLMPTGDYHLTQTRACRAFGRGNYRLRREEGGIRVWRVA